MKPMPFAVVAIAVSLLLVQGPTFAHHSNAPYDLTREITLTGTVTEFQYTNPHAQILFDVTDEQGDVSKWNSICSTPNRLRRLGWSQDSLKPGDRITISGHPAKNGSNIMVARKVVVNGKELIDD